MPNVKLQSSDGEVFDVDVDVAKVSMTIKNMLEGEFLKQAVILQVKILVVLEDSIKLFDIQRILTCSANMIAESVKLCFNTRFSGTCRVDQCRLLGVCVGGGGGGGGENHIIFGQS